MPRHVEVAADLRRSPFCERASLVEHLDPVADVHDQRHVVVDQQHARVVVVANRANDGREVGHLGLGQPGRRLVHEHEERLGRERAGYPEPAFVAVRRAIRPGRSAKWARPRSPRISSARSLAARRERADSECRNLDVLAHRQRAERMGVLEGACQAVSVRDGGRSTT